MAKIAIDFDGVLHSYQHGWTGEVPLDPPVHGALRFIQWLRDNNHDIVIMSSRAKNNEGTEGIKSWLKEHRFGEIPITCEKIHADIYIDDRGFRFEGNFDTVMDLIKNGIEPWHKGIIT